MQQLRLTQDIWSNGWRFVLASIGIGMTVGIPELTYFPWGVAIIWLTFLSAFWRLLDPTLWLAALLFAVVVQGVGIIGVWLLTDDNSFHEMLWLVMINGQVADETGRGICGQWFIDAHRTCPAMITSALAAVPAYAMVCWYWMINRRSMAGLLLAVACAASYLATHASV